MSENKTDTFLYFAYGSNMLTRRLTAVSRAPSATREKTGFVEGRRLTFDKVSTDGSGKCDIERGERTDRTHGVLFRINQTESEALDRAEGFGGGYTKEIVEAVTSAGVVKALAYVATHKDPARLPYSWYKAFVVAGAVEHELPNDYVDWLRTRPSQTDTDQARHSENEALLLYDGRNV